MSNPNVDLNNVNLSSFKIPAWLTELVNGKLKDIIKGISEPKLIPLKQIVQDKKLMGENPGREKGVNQEKVTEIVDSIERSGWKNGELCIVFKILNPSNMSSVLYNIYFTLHRYNASTQVQVKHGVVNPVLPCVVITLKDGVDEILIKRAVAGLSDRENLETSNTLIHNPYKQDDMAYNALSYINTFPELSDDEKWVHLQTVWKPEQLASGLISSQKLTAVLEKVKKRLDLFEPMIYHKTKGDRKEWMYNYYDGSFEYRGLPMTNFSLNTDKIQHPFNDDKEFYIDYWKEEDENRDFGNLLNRCASMIEDKLPKIPTLVILDCNKATAGSELPTHRKKRIESIERQMKHVSQDIRDLVHFVAFLPHSTTHDTLTTMISYEKLKREYFG